MGRHCSQCGTGTLNRVEHHFEALNVCKNCGASETPGVQFANRSPVKQTNSSEVRRRRCTFNKRRKTLPQQLEGFVEKRSTDQRRQCETLLRTYLSKMDQRSHGSVAAEARGHLKAVNLHKQSGRHESVAAGAVFVALRTHGHSVSLKDFADKLGVDAHGTNRVVTDLRKDSGVTVEPKAPTDVQQVALDVLRGAEFLTPDGDEADFKLETGRICDLVDALRRADMSGTVPLSPETVVAAAFIVYKSEAVPRRYNMKLEEFYRECELRLKAEVARSVPRAVLAVNKCLRGLVSRLPYLQKENAGQLKQTKLLHYVDDVLKYKEILLAGVLGYTEDLYGDILRENVDSYKEGENERRHGHTGYEEIDEDEIDSYIRTEAEVEALKPIFEKVLAAAAAAS